MELEAGVGWVGRAVERLGAWWELCERMEDRVDVKGG